MVRRFFSRITGVVARTLLRVPFMRRFYARRTLAFIAKSKKKKRPLPESLRLLDSQLSRSKLSPEEQLDAIETSLRPGAQEEMSRDMRRAAARQQRLGGQRGGSHRPGAPPMPRNVSRPKGLRGR